MNPVRDYNIMHYVRVLRSEKTERWYTGSTNDLRKRLKQHNKGKSPYTKNKIPWKLIYYEARLNEEDARLKEKYIKTGMGKRYLKNRLSRFPSLTG